MKWDEKRLERAFTEAPSELRDAVETAFQRGEKAMKKRHKIMVSLSAAAVFAVLVLGIALAAGRLTAPRPDPVVTAQGGGAKPSAEPTQDIMNQITPEPTPMPEVTLKTTPTPTPEITPEPTPMPAVTPLPDMMPEPTLTAYNQAGVYYYGDETCEESMEAENAATQSTVEAESAAMTAQDAWEKLAETDEMAEQAGEVWIYLSSEANGAWVFYATDRDEQKLLRTGAAWYVDEEKCVCLGRSDSVFSFCFFGTRSDAEPDYRVGSLRTRSGMHVAYGPELYTSIIQKDGRSVVHIWTLGEDGLPVEMDTGNGLCEIDSLWGILVGTISPDDDQGDLCFLYAHDGMLYQVTAQPVGIDEVEALPGGAELLAEIRGQGYTITDCLYRDMDGNIHGAGAAAITVNLERDGDHSHAYLFRERFGDALQTVRGWEDEIIFYYDKGTFNPDAGLPTLASSTLETDVKVFGQRGE